jgi:single-strand DNA-binding protein
VKFGLAVNRKYRNKNSQELVEETTFVDVEGWGSQAETFNQYMSKGRPVFVEGRLRLDSWEKEGQKRSKLVVVMEGFQFLGAGGGARDPSKSKAQAPAQGEASHVSERTGPAAAGAGEDYDFEDIPF